MAPDAATAGTPIPGNVESPHTSSPGCPPSTQMTALCRVRWTVFLVTLMWCIRGLGTCMTWAARNHIWHFCSCKLCEESCTWDGSLGTRESPLACSYSGAVCAPMSSQEVSVGEGRSYLQCHAHALVTWACQMQGPQMGWHLTLWLSVLQRGVCARRRQGGLPTISTSVRCRMSGTTCSTARHSTCERCSFTLSYSGLPLSSPAQSLGAFPLAPGQA